MVQGPAVTGFPLRLRHQGALAMAPRLQAAAHASRLGAEWLGSIVRPRADRFRPQASGSWGSAPLLAGLAAAGTGFARRQLRAQSTLRAAPSGEWAFRASVLGNEGALSGHVFLDPKGRAAYVADGVQIVGRGVGHWASCGSTVAVELDVYQYAAAAAQIPDKPHRFRGVWEANGPVVKGDWFFCPETAAPRLVGAVDVAATTMELLPQVVAAAKGPDSGPAPKVDPETTEAAMAALDAQAHLRPLSDDALERLEPYKVDGIEKVFYIPNWITPEQEAQFIREADGDMSSWEDMKTRSSQEWGAGDRCSCGRGLRRESLPPNQQRLADALHHLGVFDGALYPMNSVRINGYRPGQGIFPHCDGPVYYPCVAILSLNSPCLFHLYSRSGTEDCMKWDPSHDVPGGHQTSSRPLMTLFLEPRSLLLFSHDAFWNHRHGIDATATDVLTPNVANADQAVAAGFSMGDVIQRNRRVSLTMRHLLPRCACQG